MLDTSNQTIEELYIVKNIQVCQFFICNLYTSICSRWQVFELHVRQTTGTYSIEAVKAWCTHCDRFTLV